MVPRDGGGGRPISRLMIHVPLCFQGRDFESVYTNHRYTQKEREILSNHDSFDYLPGHSVVYKEWLRRQPARCEFMIADCTNGGLHSSRINLFYLPVMFRLDWDRWIMMGLIGVSIGIVYFLLHQPIHLMSHFKWHKAEHLLHVSIKHAKTSVLTTVCT